MFSVNLERAKKYCAYQERCHTEVRSRLIEWKVYGDELEEIMAALVEENFLNEERYAKAFVSGKFRINQWGKRKIIQHLRMKNISDYCVRKGLEVIDEDEYLAMINKLVKKRIHEKKHQSAAQLISYLMSRGYEYELIQRVIDDAS
ncbi:MAG: RecX family transcriptional regulator [Saprospiraceae bacterium]|nr:RecX family transcriptional regulator [Saprospiraceae bacterium]